MSGPAPSAAAGDGGRDALPASVAVLGLGLMGGSLARALRALPDPPRVIGWSPDAREASAAARAGVLDDVAPDAEAAAGAAELVVYATPLPAVIELFGRHRTSWREDALVTDLASLKLPVLAEATRLGVGDRHVGSHPMAGGEGSGFGASHADLYRGARVWLTGGTEAARAALARLWSALGARPSPIAAAEHDRAMTFASHLPQLVSNALALELEARGAARDELGPGGRDMTRLAASPPAMWRGLLEHATPELVDGLGGVAERLRELGALLEQGNLDAVEGAMAATRAWATRGAGSAVDPAAGESP